MSFRLFSKQSVSATVLPIPLHFDDLVPHSHDDKDSTVLRQDAVCIGMNVRMSRKRLQP